jgi:beta-lactam-binding protein with PASTA domain
MNKNKNYKVSATITIDVSASSKEQAKDAGRMQLHQLFKEPLLSDVELNECTTEAHSSDE